RGRRGSTSEHVALPERRGDAEEATETRLDTGCGGRLLQPATPAQQRQDSCGVADEADVCSEEGLEVPGAQVRTPPRALRVVRLARGRASQRSQLRNRALQQKRT